MECGMEWNHGMEWNAAIILCGLALETTKP